MKLILFDIDGTLMDSGGAGTKSMNLAFEGIFSVRAAFRGIPMAGKTDIQIMKEGLRKHGLDSENGNVGLLCDAYIARLRTEIENSKKHLKPGIEESLRILGSMEGIFLGLLTGNIQAGARIKLGSFGLNSHFPLGAFGDDHEDRNRLLPVAVERFNRFHHREVEYRDCVVIGDTPRDVECAKVYGAYSVAVATGPYRSEPLRASGADMVLNTIQEMDYSLIL
jgi:phosphoglycolate phosphatase-like HAD superfamily hydrolase